MEDTLDKGGARGRFDSGRSELPTAYWETQDKPRTRPTSLSWAPNTPLSGSQFLFLLTMQWPQRSYKPKQNTALLASKYLSSASSPEPPSLSPLSSFPCSSEGASVSLT